jgi:hypothetical protein
MPRLFALDQNFPEPIVDGLAEWLADDAELVPIRRIDARLPTADDWQVLHALHSGDRPWDGLITTDANMLGLPKELALICQTKLTLLVTVAAGHDPLKATGLLLTHLSAVCEATRRDRAQIWTLRTARKPPEDPWEHLGRVAARQRVSADALYKSERLTKRDLAAGPQL